MNQQERKFKEKAYKIITIRFWFAVGAISVCWFGALVTILDKRYGWAIFIIVCNSASAGFTFCMKVAMDTLKDQLRS